MSLLSRVNSRISPMLGFEYAPIMFPSSQISPHEMGHGNAAGNGTSTESGIPAHVLAIRGSDTSSHPISTNHENPPVLV